ncbi:response regulator transcription factor [Petrotoga sp. 9PWA.NaAc.5.4]|uniref:response regulator transcription factor n=1 Tax=Petrotoga sp. 9PWA.NaAc.5.4 TaxID=1434328 RepID=UPI000CC7BF5C|nr:response regulator transcription factor [Petrotoga sp. 9PWA.NaAc.5.4]PNR92842.1 transcriptional regulator [Petrotoga sp. 9PWA.NaAc.5.4]
MAKVLIVEDDKDIREILKIYLNIENYEIMEADSLTNMRNLLNKEKDIDIMLLDIMLPDGDAIDELPRIRTINPNIGIIIISALNRDREVIYGIESGADDYITKPFNPREVIARIKALIKRLKKQEDTTEKLEFGSLEIYPKNYTVIYKGKFTEFTTKEFEILSLLARNPDKVYSREEIIDKVWFGDEYITDRVIDVHISLIRTKIGKDWIKTIRGVGYKFNKNNETIEQKE